MDIKTITIINRDNKEVRIWAVMCGRLAIHPTLYKDDLRGETEWTVSEESSGRALVHCGSCPHKYVFKVLDMLTATMSDAPDFAELRNAKLKWSDVPQHFKKWTRKHSDTFAACRDTVRNWYNR